MTGAAIPFTEIVRGLPATVPFVGPEAIERERGGRVFRARIGANESAFGISPKAMAAMRAAVGRASWYGDPESHELRAALSERHGVAMNQIVVGGGDRARAVLQALAGEGVFIRMPGVAPLDRCVRVTVGTKEDRAVFAGAFEHVLKTV